MKKLSIFAALLLVLGLTGCVEADNPIANSGVKVNVDGVDYQLGQLATFEAPQGTEVSLTLGSWNEKGDVIGVDFGDGNIQSFKIGYTNQGPLKEDGTPGALEAHKGKVAGDGIIRVYGNDDIWYANLSGGAMPTTFNQPRLMNLVQLLISNTPAEAFELPALEQLKLFNISNCENLATIDVSQATALTNLVVNNTAITAIDLSALTALTDLQVVGNKLTALDVTNNTKLTYINANNNEIAALDLSNNAALLQVWAENNKLTEVKAPAGAALNKMIIDNNEIATLDLSGLKSIKDLTANNNKLTEVKFPEQAIDFRDIKVFENELETLVLPKAARKIEAQKNKLTKVDIVDATGDLYLEDNMLTFSTLPVLPKGLASNASKYTYAPQGAVIKVDLDFFGAFDFTKTGEYGPFKGILAEGDAKTVATFKSDEGAYTDFTEKDGIYTFTRVCNKLTGELTNAAFPELTLPTTEFAIKTYGTKTSLEVLTYALNEGDTFKSGETVKVKDGVVSITYGEEGGADFKPAGVGPSVTGFTAYTAGNGTNGEKAGGTFYTIKTEKAGTVEIAVVLNADKKFYIEEDGTALAAFNGITVTEKYYGVYDFNVKAGSSYKIYCASSKLGFYGFKFAY